MRSLRRVDSIAGPPPTLLALLGSVVIVAEMPARGAPALVVVVDDERRVHARLSGDGEARNFVVGHACDDGDTLPAPFRLVIDGRAIPFPRQREGRDGTEAVGGGPCRPDPSGPAVISVPITGEARHEVVSAPLGPARHAVSAEYVVAKRACPSPPPDGEAPCFVGALRASPVEVPAADLTIEFRAPARAPAGRALPIEVILHSRSASPLTLDGERLQVLDDLRDREPLFAPFRAPLRLAPGAALRVHAEVDLAAPGPLRRHHHLRARYDGGTAARFTESPVVRVRLTGRPDDFDGEDR